MSLTTALLKGGAQATEEGPKDGGFGGNVRDGASIPVKTENRTDAASPVLTAVALRGRVAFPRAALGAGKNPDGNALAARTPRRL